MKKQEIDKFPILLGMAEALQISIDDYDLDIDERPTQVDPSFQGAIEKQLRTHNRQLTPLPTISDRNKIAFDCLRACLNEYERFHQNPDLRADNCRSLDMFAATLNGGIEHDTDEILFLRMHTLAEKAGVAYDRLIEEARDYDILTAQDCSSAYVTATLFTAFRAATGSRKAILREALACYCNNKPFLSDSEINEWDDDTLCIISYENSLTRQSHPKMTPVFEAVKRGSALVRDIYGYWPEGGFLAGIHGHLLTLFTDCIELYLPKSSKSPSQNPVDKLVLSALLDKLFGLINDAKTFSTHLSAPEQHFAEQSEPDEQGDVGHPLNDFKLNAVYKQRKLLQRVETLQAEFNAVLPSNHSYLAKKILGTACLILGIVTFALSVMALLTMPPAMLGALATLSSGAATTVACTLAATGAVTAIISAIGLYRNTNPEPKCRASANTVLAMCHRDVASLEATSQEMSRSAWAPRG